ncbi:MAG: ABC transporter permease subunit, partial [Candidatus Omnitrophota bacterium]|nr:ABC transporter permease subunit [Candidatus Omnitrophota bacterium]
IMEFIFVFLMPILTMKIFAEEKQNGTMEFLMTTPTTNSQIVLGKYFGYLVFFSFLIFLTGIYYVILEGFAQPDRWTILIGYLGIWLEGAFFLAVGMLISSWTRHQMVAAMGAYIFLFMLYFSISFIQYCSGSLQTIVRFLSTWSHLENFSSGLFTSADVIYYLSGIGLCLALTRLSIENRLWR